MIQVVVPSTNLQQTQFHLVRLAVIGSMYTKEFQNLVGEIPELSTLQAFADFPAPNRGR